MRAVLLVFLVAAVGLAGCTEEPETETPDFERTCPVYYTADQLEPRWRNEAMYYNATSPSEDAQEEKQRDKWMLEPTIQGGFAYRGGRLAYVEIDINVDFIADGYLYFEVYRASQDERTARPQDENGEYTMSEEEYMRVTGDRLLWKDASEGPGARPFSQVTIGPHEGYDDIPRWINGTYRVEFPEGEDPSRIRVDAFFEADQDGKDSTDSLAWFTAKANFWWLHQDCF